MSEFTRRSMLLTGLAFPSLAACQHSGCGTPSPTGEDQPLETLSITDFMSTGRDIGPALNAMAAHFGGSPGNLGFGEFIIPRGEWEMSKSLLSTSQCLRIRGIGRPAVSWSGAPDGTMFQIRDSSAWLLENVILLGNGIRPDKAIHYDDTGATTPGSATNEHLTISDICIGRRWNQNSQIYTGEDNGFVYGIYVGGPNLVNNDSFYVERSQIHDCTGAGILIASNQSIWNDLTNVVVDSCGYGIDTRSNIQARNLGFNRNTIADLRIRDDTVHDITGFNAENSKLLIEQSANASLRVRGGKALLSALMTGDYWATFSQAKDIHFEDWWVDAGTTSGKRVRFDASSTQTGRIYIRHCRLPKGDHRDGYELNAAAATCGLRFDIEEGAFRAKGTLDGSQAYSPAPMAHGASQLVSQAMAAGAGIAKGDPYLVSFSDDLDGVMLTGNAYDDNLLYCRFNNEGEARKGLASGKLRWRRIADGEIKARRSATLDQPVLPDGMGKTVTLSCPCRFGDFVYWAYTADDRFATKSAYVSAANRVAVRFQNESGIRSDPGSGTLNVFIVKESAFDFMGAQIVDPASLPHGANAEIRVSIPGARRGDHALAAFGLDLRGIHHAVEIYADNLARILLLNKTGAPIDLGAMQVRVGAFIALG